MALGTLVFFCGKMGAGKSTKSAELAAERNAVLLSEDEWLQALYPDQISTLADYAQYSNRLKPPIKKLVQSILCNGIDVVMDFPANTKSQRAWLKTVFEEVGAPHQLIFVDVPDHVCLAQIEKRRAEHPERAATDTAEMFAEVTRHFVEPDVDEGFTVVKAD